MGLIVGDLAKANLHVEPIYALLLRSLEALLGANIRYMLRMVNDFHAPMG